MKSQSVLAAALVVCGCTAPAFAQDSAPPSSRGLTDRAAQGTAVVVEPIRDRYVFAPEAKVTQIDGDTAALVGGYAGVLLQEAVLLGGGVYTMPDGPNGSSLTYGGMVVGFMLGDQRRFSYGIRGLVGIGHGELTDAVSFGRPARPMPWRSSQAGSVVVREVRYEDSFMVFEPQADLNVRLGGSWRLAFGIGYRLTNASEYFDDRMHGVTGTVAIRFGGAR